MTDLARAKAVDRYSSARPDLAEQLAFFARLWDAQDEAAAGAAGYTPALADDLARALNHHQPLLSLVAPEVPLDAYRDAVRAVSTLIATGAGLPEEQATALAEADFAGAIGEEDLASILSGFDVLVQKVADAAGSESLSPALVGFVLSEALTPLVRDAAKSAVSAVGKFDWLQWDSGLCPACGTPASSGVLRDEGELQGSRRWLSCPLCRTQWEYARVRCARCGSRDQRELEYLYDEADPAHRIHTCAACHGYTPVTFERELHAIAVPEIEEIVMVPLETVAAERGFTALGDDLAEAPN